MLPVWRDLLCVMWVFEFFTGVGMLSVPSRENLALVVRNPDCG
jgi:hypothetical protein